MNDVKKWMEEARTIVFLTGAGVSTESGIPDFRSSEGIWNQGVNREFYLSRYYRQKNPKDFWQKYKDIFDLEAMNRCAPNSVHQFIHSLENAGKEVSVFTQNVDGLHQKAGSSQVFEMHGNMRTAICPKCKREYPLSYMLENKVPRCIRENGKGHRCHFILHPDMVLFGDRVQYVKEAEKKLKEADLFMVMGTSLKVKPVCDLPLWAKRRSRARRVFLNQEPTEMDSLFHAVIRGTLGDAVNVLRIEKKENGV